MSHKAGFSFPSLADHAAKLVALLSEVIPVEDKLLSGEGFHPVGKEASDPSGPVSQKDHPFALCPTKDEE